MSKILAWFFWVFRDKDLDDIDGKNIRMTNAGLLYSVGPLANRSSEDLNGDQKRWKGRVMDNVNGRLILQLEPVKGGDIGLRPGDRVEIKYWSPDGIPHCDRVMRGN